MIRLDRDLISLFEHDLFEKPLRTFPDHAVAVWSKLFESLQVRQQVVNLVGIEHELRHRRMTGVDAFGQRLAEGFNGVAQVQGPKRRRDLQRAWTCPVDRVAPGTMAFGIGVRALLGGIGQNPASPASA
jgi:hypothetical protein